MLKLVGINKVTLASCGELLIRGISATDTERIHKLAKLTNLSDRAYIAGVLSLQIQKPTLDHRTIDSWSSNDIVRCLIGLHAGNQRVFGGLDISSISFSQIRKTIANYAEKGFAGSRVVISKSVNSAVTDWARMLPGIARQAEQMQRLVASTVQSVLPHVVQLQRQMNGLMSNSFVNLLEQHNASVAESMPLLVKYRWLISPTAPVTLTFEAARIARRGGRQDKELNALFVDWFSANNWGIVEDIVRACRSSILLRRRGKILADCLQTLQLPCNRRFNPVNVVLPSIIAQIEGAARDYMDTRGHKNGWRRELRKSFPKILGEHEDDLAMRLLLDVLYQHSKRGKSLKIPFYFNRHKIMHGESLAYGKKHYLVRAVMILDYLAHFK